jgi:RNA polymerase sigma-70 factor, ECF subfamily
MGRRLISRHPATRQTSNMGMHMDQFQDCPASIFDDTIEPSSEGFALDRRELFEHVVVPHLTDAYRLAHAFTRNGPDADDVLQDASLRLFRFVANYRGGDARSWVLRVVRNAAFSWLKANRRCNQIPLDGDRDGMPGPGLYLVAEGSDGADPSVTEEQRAESEMLRVAIGDLTHDQREIVVLRDVKGLAYREIAETLSVPIGTVMSRLSRAHAALQRRLERQSRGGGRRLNRAGVRAGNAAVPASIR